jgi:hypothetical protein
MHLGASIYFLCAFLFSRRTDAEKHNAIISSIPKPISLPRAQVGMQHVVGRTVDQYQEKNFFNKI